LADSFKSVSLKPSSTSNTIVYTVPTADQNSQPPILPTTTIIKSIRLANVSGNQVTTTVVMMDSSNLNLEVVLYKDGLAHEATHEVLTNPIVLEKADQIKITAATADAVEILLSIMEIT
tara:strand:- start:102 stop:458 length:357 start_codon:yes stop_codon:yes gene_type:complete